MLKTNFNIKVSVEGYVDVDGKKTSMDLQTKMSGDCDTNLFEEIKDVVSFFKKLDDEDKKDKRPRHYYVKKQKQETEQPASSEFDGAVVANQYTAAACETGLDLIQSLSPDQVRKLKKLLKRL